MLLVITAIVMLSQRQISAGINHFLQPILQTELAKLNDQIRGELHFQAFQYIFPNTLRFQNVVILDGQGTHLIEAPAVSLKISPITLFSKTIVLSSLALEEPKLVLKFSKSQLNLAHVFEATKASQKSPLSLNINSLSAKSANINLTSDSGENIEMSNTDLESKLAIEKSEVTYTVSKATIQQTILKELNKKDLNLGKIAFKNLVFDKEKYSASLISFFTKFGDFSLTGYYNHIHELVHLSVDGKIPTENLRLKLKISGKLNTFDSTLKTEELTCQNNCFVSEHTIQVANFNPSLQGIKVKFDSNLKNAPLFGKRLNSLYSKGHFEISDKNTFKIPFFLFTADGQSIQGDGKASLIGEKLKINNLSLSYLQSKIQLFGSIAQVMKNPTLSINFTIKDFLLQHIVPTKGNKLSASISSIGKLSGKINNPTVAAFIKAPDLRLYNSISGYASSHFNYSKKQLNFDHFQFDGPDLTLDSDRITVDLAKKLVTAELKLKQLKLSLVDKYLPFSIKGVAYGNAHIKWPFSKGVQAKAKIVAKPFQIEGLSVGKTVANITLNEGGLTVASLSEKNLERLSTQLAYNLESKNILAHVDVKNLDINPWSKHAQSPFLPLTGNISGTLDFESLAGNQKVNLDLTTNQVETNHEYAIETRTNEFSLASSKNAIGHLKTKLVLENNQLKWTLCGSPNVELLSKCDKDSTINLFAKGSFYNPTKYKLDLGGKIILDDVELLLKQVRSLFSDFSISTSFLGKIESEENGQNLFSVEGDLQRFTGQAAGMPPFNLTKTAKIYLTNESIVFSKPIELLINNIDRLSITGKANRKKLQLSLDGNIPLILLKLALPNVLSATGSMRGSLTLTGSRAKPVISGKIDLLPDSTLSFLKYTDPVRFIGGKLIFTQKNNDVEILIENLKAHVGDGSIEINGTSTLTSSYNFQKIQLDIIGNDVQIKSSGNWVDTSFKLTGGANQLSSSISGQVRVIDGQAKSNFSFQDLVIESTSSSFKLPSWKFLDDIKLDIKFDVDNFNYYADINLFSFEADFASTIKLGGTILKPTLEGTIDLISGDMDFPSTTLTLLPTIISFGKTSLESFNPNISLSASGILYQPIGLSPNNINVSAELIGKFRKAQLNLFSSSTTHVYTNIETLLMLLQPGAIGTTDPQKALLSLSTNLLSSPVTDEIGKAISDKTNSRFRIGTFIQDDSLATQLQWRFGQRLRLEGTALTSSSTFNVSNIRIQFLLFDHLPLGDSLIFEGVFLGSTPIYTWTDQYSNVKLKYRLFEL